MSARFVLMLSFLAAVLPLSAQWIIVPSPPPMPRPAPGMFALECQSLQVESVISSAAAQTVLNQTFYNPSSHQLEGYYYFPLPEGATIMAFSMFINGKETPAELLDAEKARKIYEDIVRKQLDPALLEYSGRDLLRVRIFPVQPKSTVQVRLQLSHLLPADHGLIQYSLPIPRHRADHPQSSPQMSMRVRIDMGGESLKTIYSPTHEIDINRSGKDKAVVGFEGPATEQQNRFELFLQNDQRLTSASLLGYHREGEDGYFLLNLDPGHQHEEAYAAKDVTFVLDASGSMAGARMEQAQKALQFCVAQLNPADRFNIVRFSTEASSLFPQLEPADQEHKKQASGYINGLRAIGGTNIEEAMQMALSQRKDPKRPYLIVFLSDGKPTIGETRVDSLLTNVQNWNKDQVRIFTFGIGVDLDTRLLDLLSSQSRGSRTYVLPEEDIELKVSNFFERVGAPVLTDIELELQSSSVRWEQLYPRPLPDLFRGGNLSVLGRYKGSGKATLVVKGYLEGQQKTMRYELEFPKKQEQFDYLPALWATRAVGYLLDQIRKNGESEELVQEVVRLAKKHGIVTPYTSYLILEDEVQQIGMNRLRQEDALLPGRVPEETRSQTRYEQGMKQREGRGSVEASADIQRMNEAGNLQRSHSTDPAAQEIRQAQGRAFYRNNQQWVDAEVARPENQNLPRTQIRFQSDDYFQLLKKEPGIHQILALGTELRFVWKGRIFEILN